MMNLCGDCENAVPNGKERRCPWAERFEPVPGWTAEKVPFAVSVERKSQASGYSYNVTACPLFKEG